MKGIKLIITALALASALTAVVFSPTARAQGLLNESGSATLADVFGTATGPEALTVNWSVVESPFFVYTYTYTVQNPAGDVLLNGDDTPTSNPEIVDALSVQFNATVPGAYVANSQSGGATEQNNGAAGLFWSFAAVSPGASSPALSFQSDLPPVQGNANASGDNPPAPWSSVPNGQQVPVPSSVPEPATFSLLAGTLLLFPFRAAIVRIGRKREDVNPPPKPFQK
jgi:hypothetical protein